MTLSSATAERKDFIPSWLRRSGGSLPFLTFNMFLFFGIHNVLQEAIMKEPGFQHGVMLGYFEVLGYVRFIC